MTFASMRTRRTAIPSTTMENKMETVFVLFGEWHPERKPRLVGVFRTEAAMEEEMEWNRTHVAPYDRMWHLEVQLKE